MSSWSVIRSNIKNAMEYIRKQPILDAAARSLLEDLPLVGGFLVKTYENTAGSDEDKSRKILQFLGHLETHNEKEFDRISKAIVDNYDTIIKSVIESRIQILEAIQSSEGRLTERLNQLEGSNRGGYQVSYVIIEVKNLNIIETLSKLVSALNVQLMQNNQEIPFVPFNSFDSTQQGKNLFLYGRSGAGKSRSILENMRTHLRNYKKIYLINPAKVLGEKTFREDISHLVAKFNGQDAVIWDNFPLDLTHRSSEGAKEALEIVSFTNANKVILSLNPTYPETYKKMSFELPEITSIEIIYTKENIKDILKMYGERIDAFQELYQRYVQPNINTIATILWQKEPTPLIVFEYLKHLYAMRQKLFEGISTSVSEAKQLYPMINFYENQLKHMRRPKHSNPNLHFLYTLKLCYDLGLARNFDLLQQLQDSIFQSRVPTEPSYELSSWIYLSGSYYSMHDIPKEAIQFSPDILLKMTNYLKENPQVMLGDDQTLYQSGVFIGKNLQYLISETYPFLLSEKFDVLTRRGEDVWLKRKEVAEGYHSIDDTQFQQRLIEVSNKYKDPFGLGVGYGFARIFPSLNQEERDKIWRRLMQLLNKNIEVGFGFGDGIARIFPSLNQEERDKIWNMLLDFQLDDVDFITAFGESIAQILDGFSEGIAQIFESISEQDFQNILMLAKKYPKEVAAPLGIFCARKLLSLQQDSQIQERIMQLTKKSSLFAAGLGTILRESFTELNDAIQDALLNEAKQNPILYNALGL